MRNSIVQVVGACLLGPLMGGCPSTVSEVRQNSNNRREFVSTKPADALSGCISQAWTDEGGLPSTTPTGNGWLIVAKGGDWVGGVVEIAKSKTGSVVVYNSNYDRLSTKTYIPLIQKCL